jgi:glycosyltransferase involved in cell wall biosynthesis
MKIAYVIPGSGGTFYCENCVRDLDFVHAMRRLGHEVVVIPMYLPLFPDDSEIDLSLPIFYGAINVYLKYKLPILRKAPPWVTRIFDAPVLLKAAGKKAGSTRAATLGEMTVSLLRGEEGEHAGDLNRLVRSLGEEVRPDVVHLSNALLLGLVRRIKQDLGVPVTCSLQDEDTWVDTMESSHAEEVWGLMRERAPEVDAFFPVSRYYAEKMSDRVGIPRERLHVVYIGLDLDRYRPGPAPLSFDPPVVGFLSRISESQGIGLLAEAFIKLKRESSLRDARLHISGGQTGDDRKFIRGITKRLEASGVLEDVEIVQDFGKDSRIRFLSSLTALSVPALSGHAFGSYLIEALALGIPVVQPKIGAFPELLRQTGGGVVYAPNDVDALVTALTSLLCNRERATALGEEGSRTVHENFGLETMAERMLEVYRSCRNEPDVKKDRN